jgi:hypothetical protein
MLLNDDDFTVFVNVCSHIESVNVAYHPGGWSEHSEQFTEYHNFNDIDVDKIIVSLKHEKAYWKANESAVKAHKRKQLLAQLKWLDNE